MVWRHIAHDILGTYQAILKSKSDASVPQNFVAFATQLREWNARVIESRHAKNPGEFKTQVDRAGNTVFVVPELVIGTLGKGYEIIMSAATPGNRAALTAYVVAEVHPFADGNGLSSQSAAFGALTQSKALERAEMARLVF